MKQNYILVVLFVLLSFFTLSAKPTHPLLDAPYLDYERIDIGATISGSTTVCINATQPQITFTGSGGTAPYTFTYTINGGSTLTVSSDTGNTATISAPTGSAGTFTYELVSVVDSSQGATPITESGTATIIIVPDFSVIAGNSITVCKGNAINLSSSLSTGAPSGVTYSWSGPNNYNSTSQSPTINNATAAMTGTYTVTASKGQCHKTDTMYVTVLEPTVASANLQEYQGSDWLVKCTNPGATTGNIFINNGLASNLQSLVTGYTVNWGDGSTSFTSNTGNWNNGNNINHTYNIGLYTLTITITTTLNCTINKNYTVFIGNQPASPQIQLPINAQGCVPFELTFPISGVSANTPGTTYIITFSDDPANPHYYNQSNIPSSITHQFSTSSCSNTFTNGSTIENNAFGVSMQAINPCGSASSSAGPIRTSTPPTAIVTGPTTGCINQTVTIIDASVNGSIVTANTCNVDAGRYWEITPSTGWSLTGSNLGNNGGFPDDYEGWNYGSQNLNIQFSAAGTYTVKLYKRNGCSGTSSTTKTICIEPALTSASFTLNNTTGCGSIVAQATNTTPTINSCNVTYNWSVSYSVSNCGTAPASGYNYFTNGTTATSANPSFSFPNPGTYTVTLTAHNSCGNQSATQTVTVKAPPAVSIGAISNVCGGSSAVISPTATVTNCGSNTLTYSWSFPGGTPSTSTNANPGTISYTTSGNHTVTLQVTNECGTTTDTETFNVTPEVIANAGNDVTLCSGGSATLSGMGSGGSGSGYTYQWLSSANTVLSNNQNYTVTPTATTTYTLKVTNGSCNTTDTVTVFINTITPGTIGTDQILCSGTDPAAFTETVVATGAGTLTYQWESSTTSATGTFTDISGATSATYDAPVLTQTTWFRRKITSTLNAVTCTSTSNTVSVTINTITQSAIGSDQTICTGGVPAAFTAASASGSGNITYQWQSSADNVTFANISGATSATYSPATLTQTTYYKRIAKSTLSSVVCSLESNVITITVVADPTITTQPLATQSVCQNAVPTTLQVVAEGGVGTFTYQWFSSNSPSGSSATQISGATQSSYTLATTATGTKYYYCVVSQTGLGCSVNSSIVQVQVLQAPTINTQPISSTVCAGGNPALLTVAYTNGMGAASYQWYSNTTNSTSGAIAITGATTASYQAPASTVGVIYYYAIISFDSGGCSSITSAIASVTVNALPQIVTQPIAEQNICVGGSVSPLTVTGSSTSGAATYQWYSNTTNSITGGTAITGATTASYTPPTYTTAGSRYYYVIITYANSGCGTVTSNVATVNVVADPVITTQPITTQSLCQSPLAGEILANASGGYGTLLYQWYSNAANNTTGGNSIAGATNATYTPPATTVGTIYYYCIITTAASGCSVTSNTSAVVVLSAPYVSTQPQPQTLCFGAMPALLTTAYTNGTGTPQYQWFNNSTNSNTGGIAISGATNSSYQPSGAAAGTTYYYLQITFATGGCSVITSNAVAVTINPLPQVATAQQQTICSGGSFSITPQDGNGNSLPTGTQYTWSAPIGSGFSGGTAQSVPQSSISQTLTNTTNAPVTATYTVTPIANSCSGQTFTVTITVNPKPFINTQAVTVCTGEPFDLTSFSGSNNIIPSGTTYSWSTPTMTDTNMGGQPATDADSITGTLTNTTNTTQTATYSVTPKWTSGAGTCTGNPFTVTVTVKPKPAITTMSTSICSGGSFSSTPVNGTDGTVPSVPFTVGLHRLLKQEYQVLWQEPAVLPYRAQ